MKRKTYKRPTPELLALILAEFWERSFSHLVHRPTRIGTIEGKVDVFIGMRRTGKTYLAYQRIQDLRKQGIPQSAILYLNFEDDRILPVDREGLASLLEDFYRLHPENHDRRCYLFLDEIQNVDEWPAVIRRFLDTRNVHITLTGSSAKLLSREIATSLRGRSIATEVWPMGFDEYLDATGQKAARSSASPRSHDFQLAALQSYLKTGGMPEVPNLQEFDRRRILQDYVSLVILKDLVERHKIKNEALLKYFVKILLTQVARPMSINKIAKDLKSQGRKTGKNTLYQYLEHIEDCFLAFSVPLFTESLRKQQTNPRKIYAIDTGMAYSQSLAHAGNLGRLFENLIFLDLKRAGFEVAYYLTETGREIDFIATGPDGRVRAVQACLSMADPETREREEAALQEGMAELKLPGQTVTLDNYAVFVNSLKSL